MARMLNHPAAAGLRRENVVLPWCLQLEKTASQQQAEKDLQTYSWQRVLAGFFAHLPKY
jgi:hypothetical protein